MIKKVDSVYVAASSLELDRAEKWIKLLRDAGIAVTSTWTESVRAKGHSNPREGASVDADRLGYALENRSRVLQADLLWFLAPESKFECNHGRGGYYEAGIADAAEKVLVFSGDTRQSVFCARGLEFMDDLTAFACICKFTRDGVVQ